MPDICPALCNFIPLLRQAKQFKLPMNLTMPNDFQEALTDSQLHTAFQRGVTGSEKLFTVQTILTFHNKLTLKAEWLVQYFKGNKLCILPKPYIYLFLLFRQQTANISFTQHYLVGLCNGNTVCSLRVRN
jgi:hypothetical protein